MRYALEATNSDLLWGWHFDYLGDILQAVADYDPETRFLIINMPPRFAKSTIAGTLWQAWMIGREDSSNSAVFSIASSATLAARDSLQTLNLLRQPFYQALFPHVHINKETEAEWNTHGGAYRVAVGAEGTVTGRGAKHLLVDDLLQADEADSPTVREKRNEWLGRTLRSRLDDPRRGTITVIQQRLHEDDSTGHLLKLMETPGADQYLHINLPLIAPTTVPVPVTFKGRTYAVRQPGECLHPARFTPEVITALRISQGHRFEAQYQQNPVSRAGGFFDINDLQWYEPNDLPATSSLNWMVGADYATSARTTSDQTAILAAGIDHTGVLWIHPESILAHLDPLEAVQRTVALCKKLKTHILGHEKGVIANTLRPLFDIEMSKHKHFLSTETYARTSSKAVHAAAIKGLMRSSKVKLPRILQPIWEPLILRFRPDTDGDKDDLIDALATIGILYNKATLPPPPPGHDAPTPTTENEDDDAAWERIFKRSSISAPAKAGTLTRLNGEPYAPAKPLV